MIQKTMDKPEIPEDPMLEEINWDDDKMLVKVLEKIKKENQSIAPLNATAPTPEITSQNAVVLQPGPSAPNIVSNVAAGAKLPIMYFPHSNVTINYHIHQWKGCKTAKKTKKTKNKPSWLFWSKTMINSRRIALLKCTVIWKKCRDYEPNWIYFLQFPYLFLLSVFQMD